MDDRRGAQSSNKEVLEEEEFAELPEAPQAPGFIGTLSEPEPDEISDADSSSHLSPFATSESFIQSVQSPPITSPGYNPLSPPYAPYHSQDSSLVPIYENTDVSSITQIPAKPHVYKGCSSIKDYSTEKIIGSGTFGVVKLARHKITRKKVALKQIKINSEDEGMPMTILKKLDHPNIIKLLDMAMTDKAVAGSYQTFMVLPYVEHDLDGILQNPLVRLEVCEIKSYMQQILRGIEYMHKMMILHRDIKSANILIGSKGWLRIADFGLARPYSVNGHLTNKVITLWYRPPEILMGETKYDGSADMWGVGCVFGEILKRRAILPGESEIGQLNEIWKLCGTPNSKTWPDQSYLELPLFKSGALSGFGEYDGDESGPYMPKSLSTYYNADRFRNETYNLLDDLLNICPKRRLTATQALAYNYFTTYPLAIKPDSEEFKIFADSHESDAKKARDNRAKTGSHLVLPTHFDTRKGDDRKKPAVMKPVVMNEFSPPGGPKRFKGASFQSHIHKGEKYGVTKYDDFSIKDSNGQLWFRIDSQNFSIHDKRKLVDASGKAVIHLSKKIFSIGTKWVASDHSGKQIFTVHPKIFSVKPCIHVCMSNNDNSADIEIRGGWKEKDFKFADLANRNVIATVTKQRMFNGIGAFFNHLQDKDCYYLNLQPGADSALCSAVTMLLDELYHEKS